MKIVFDLDNTLVDEFGSRARPGIVALLGRLRDEGHELALWTHSERPRAMRILKEHRLREFFAEIVCREDYDPAGEGLRKKVESIGGQFLIDDDPEEVAAARKRGVAAFRIASYRKGTVVGAAELDRLHRQIGRAGSWLGRLFGSGR